MSPEHSQLAQFIACHDFKEVDAFLGEQESNPSSMQLKCVDPGDQSETMMTLIRGSVARVRLLRECQCHRALSNDHIKDWTTVSREDPQEFQSSSDSVTLPDPLEVEKQEMLNRAQNRTPPTNQTNNTTRPPDDPSTSSTKVFDVI